ncbi:hypothetical protein Tco_0514131 [Tanacetum coccineum]
MQICPDYQIIIVHTEHRDGVAGFKRRRQDFHGDGVMDLTMALGRSRLKTALENSIWRRRHAYNTTLLCVENKTWLFESEGGGGGRGVKEKQHGLSNKTYASIHMGVKEGVTPSVVDMTVEKDMFSSLDDTTGSSLPLPTPITTSAGNAPVVPVESIRAISERFANTAYGSFLGKRVAYLVVANYVKLHGVPVTAFSEHGLNVIATKLGTPLMLDSYTSDMCIQSWGRSSYARVIIELRADVELKDNIVVAMPKFFGKGHYICNVRVEYESGATLPSGGLENDVEFDTNGGTTNLVNNEATSSGSSFMNVDNSSTRTTPIIDKIRKFEELLTSGKATLVDEAGNPLKNVDFLDDYDSEDEVASVDNDMARSMTSERVGFGTQSLLEQWMDSYSNCDYDEDPYDDDMYDGYDLPQELQAICDNLDIRVRGRKKK